MKLEEFKKIKVAFNKIIDVINHTKINGRYIYITKFENKHRILKNELDIPKIKTYEETISYHKEQVLYEYYFNYESSREEEVKLKLNLNIDFQHDEYKCKMFVNYLDKGYSPSIKIAPVNTTLLDINIDTNDFSDFIIRFDDAYYDLAHITINSVKVFSNDEDAMAIYESKYEILDKLNEEQ